MSIKQKQFLKRKGYRIEDCNYFITDHTWNDLFQIMQEYCEQENEALQKQVDILTIEKKIRQCKDEINFAVAWGEDTEIFENDLVELENQLKALKGE